MSGDSPAAIKLTRMWWNPGARATEAGPHVYQPEKCHLAVGAEYYGGGSGLNGTLERRHDGAERGDLYRVVGDYWTFNQQLEAVPWPSPSLEQATKVLEGATYFVTLDLLQGFFQMPMDAKVEEAFPIDHFGTVATLQVVNPFCMSNTVETDVESLVEQCLHSMDGKAGVLKPRPLDAVVHDKEVDKVPHSYSSASRPRGRWARAKGARR